VNCLNKKAIIFGITLIFLALFSINANARYTLYERYLDPTFYALPSNYYFEPYYPSTYFDIEYYNNGKYYALSYANFIDRYYGDFVTVKPNYWFADFGYGYYSLGGYYYPNCGYYNTCYTSRILYPVCIGYFCYS